MGKEQLFFLMELFLLEVLFKGIVKVNKITMSMSMVLIMLVRWNQIRLKEKESLQMIRSLIKEAGMITYHMGKEFNVFRTVINILGNFKKVKNKVQTQYLSGVIIQIMFNIKDNLKRVK